MLRTHYYVCVLGVLCVVMRMNFCWADSQFSGGIISLDLFVAIAWVSVLSGKQRDRSEHGLWLLGAWFKVSFWRVCGFPASHGMKKGSCPSCPCWFLVAVHIPTVWAAGERVQKFEGTELGSILHYVFCLCPAPQRSLVFSEPYVWPYLRPYLWFSSVNTDDPWAQVPLGMYPHLKRWSCRKNHIFKDSWDFSQFL